MEQGAEVVCVLPLACTLLSLTHCEGLRSIGVCYAVVCADRLGEKFPKSAMAACTTLLL